jgi:hypothetical protein
MNVLAVKQELHGIIEAMPERRLFELRRALIDEPYIFEQAVIEDNLTSEEMAVIEAGDKEFTERPENFISLDDFLAHGADYRP